MEDDDDQAAANAEYDQNVWQGHVRNTYAQQNAAQEAQRPESTTGASLEADPSIVDKKLRGGFEGTVNALHLLGAGQPYLPGGR